MFNRSRSRRFPATRGTVSLGLDDPLGDPPRTDREFHGHPPLPGGLRYHVYTVPPQHSQTSRTLSVEDGSESLQEQLPGRAAYMESDQDGMHRTPSVDLICVLSGEIWLELDAERGARSGGRLCRSERHQTRLAEQGRQALQDGSGARWRGSALIHRRQPVSPFDDGTTIVTERLSLVPLRVEDAEEMTGVLGDERLHEFIGGEPETITGLRERYARLVAGSSDPDKLWLNWVVRRRSDAQAMGTVQATLTMGDGESTANVAWVIGVDWQNQGFRGVRGGPSSRRLAAAAWCRQRRRPHPSRSPGIGGGCNASRPPTHR